MRPEEVEGLTVGGLLDRVAGRRPHDDALVYADRGLRLTYAEFRREVERCARALMALGLRKGDHVAVWAQNVPEWVVLQFATGKTGTVLVTVNPAYRAAELRYVLEQSDAAALFLTGGVKDADFLGVLGEAVPGLADAPAGEALEPEGLPHLRHVVLVGEPAAGAEVPPAVLRYGEFLRGAEGVPEEELAARQGSLGADEVINMQYTSGTTGFPKGVQLTHANIVKNAFYVGECMELGPGDRVCIPVPFFHCFGCVLGTLNAVAHEGTMVPVEQFDPLAVLEAVEAERCTALLGVPTMFIAELGHPEFGRFDTGSLRTGIMAGSPCPVEVMKRVVEEMGAGEITIAYGQTEASPVITQTRTDDPIERRVSTVGRSLPNVEVRIVDPATGEGVAPGEVGELCTRGYHIMEGYYKMPEKTREAIDREGWLHTRDLATMDEWGYVQIRGRADDMILRGGENIHPREVEELLYTHPGVSDVQVYGVPDEKYGEQVAAAVIPREGADLTEEGVREFCRDAIAAFKVPRYVEFVTEFPMTASGKVQKFRLREATAERRGLRQMA